MTVDEYIAGFAPEIKERLLLIRDTIRLNAPEAEEKMAYGMPGYKLHGKVLVYFAAHTNHIGFYALPSGHLAFKKELAKYKQGKGSVQFQNAEPLPLDLIAQMVQFRAYENAEKAALAASSKKKK